MPHVNKRPLERKPIFVQICSYSTLKRVKKFQAAKPLAFFAPLPVSAGTKPLLEIDFKDHKFVRTDLKKDSAPIQFKFFEL